jgi:hypothetical protein
MRFWVCASLQQLVLAWLVWFPLSVRHRFLLREYKFTYELDHLTIKHGVCLNAVRALLIFLLGSLFDVQLSFLGGLGQFGSLGFLPFFSLFQSIDIFVSQHSLRDRDVFYFRPSHVR